jgi:hypothetical protein
MPGWNEAREAYSIERRDNYWARIADELEAHAEEQQKLEDSRRDLHNKVQAFIKAQRVDHDMAISILEALQSAAQRDRVLHDAELSAIDEAKCFIDWPVLRGGQR